jgi:hypothetical protein
MIGICSNVVVAEAAIRAGFSVKTVRAQVSGLLL